MYKNYGDIFIILIKGIQKITTLFKEKRGKSVVMLIMRCSELWEQLAWFRI